MTDRTPRVSSDLLQDFSDWLNGAEPGMTRVSALTAATLPYGVMTVNEMSETDALKVAELVGVPFTIIVYDVGSKALVTLNLPANEMRRVFAERVREQVESGGGVLVHEASPELAKWLRELERQFPPKTPTSRRCRND